MEPLIIVILGACIIWARQKFGEQKRTTEELRSELFKLEREVKKLSAAPTLPRQPSDVEMLRWEQSQQAERAAEPVAPPAVEPPSLEWQAYLASKAAIPTPIAEEVTELLAEGPPPLPIEIPEYTESALTPSIPDEEPALPPEPNWIDSINWEQFMGAKLFAWLGGLALFLAVAFFVKYSFDHDLIPPAMRVAIGFMVGVGLVIGGLRTPRERYAITAQTLVAAGIVSLYAVTFACRSIYHFEFFGPLPTFLLMSLITAAAFVLAVRMDARVVAILGILGGFIAPVLLSTDVNNPAGLFGYIAVLNIGLIAVALHRSWFHLVPLGATCTVLTMIGWAAKFYTPGKTATAMVICLGFAALFIGAVEAARRLQRGSPLLVRTAVALLAIAFCFAGFFLTHREVAERAWLFFGYVVLVSAGVFFLSWRENLERLIAVAAGITTLLMIGWTAQTFHPEQTAQVVSICLVFSAIYFVIYLLARRRQRATQPVMWAAVGMPCVSLAFALFLINHPAAGVGPWLLFMFILASDGLLLALAWLDERLPRLHLVAGLTVFGLLSVWTTGYLTAALLPWALAMYLVFAALHTVFPLLLERRCPTAAPTWWSQLFPPLALVLMLLPIFRLEAVGFILWPAILIVDLIAVGLAVLSASMLAVAAVLVLTLLATGLSIFRIPVTAGLDLTLLLIIGGFAVFFFAACLLLARRIGPKLGEANQRISAVFGDPRAQLPAFASLLPFLLLIMACARLAVTDPSAVFGLGLLLSILTLGLTKILVRGGQPASVGWLPACALAGMAALEIMWHVRHFDAAGPGRPLAWHLGFYAVFAIYPFLFRRDFAKLTGPWAVAALSGLAHFWVIYQSVKLGWPRTTDFLGAVPALFAVAPLVSLLVILRTVPADNPKRLNQLAWFGGVALFFITLIFPIQFERQWLTVAWALEGAALLWLFHRVPHPALRATGFLLLIIAFVRLALNPAVLGYHVRGDTGILNWYLYAYGITAAALFASANLTALPRNIIFKINAPPILNALGTILAFLLLNIEIADYFTAPGNPVLAFNFSGNFARDMSYTIGWALFALALLSAGIWLRTKAARYAALALLSVALLKLFFHDLANLEALYRVGALTAVAVIAMLASFAYQRFLPSHEKNNP